MKKIFSFSFLFFMVLFTSCLSTKEIPYFENLQDTTLRAVMAKKEPVLQVNDLVTISVSSLNTEASAIFNAPIEMSKNTTADQSGYLVGQDGNIQFPVLGQIRAAGYTKKELGDYLTNQLKDRKLLVDPIVSIRLINFKVSILGEVGRPGVYPVPSERTNLLEALSYAGDITVYGKKDNVLLIRESQNGDKQIKRLDLESQSILESPYYYLQSNDIIYVEASKNRANKERNALILPVVFSLISLAIVAITSFD